MVVIKYVNYDTLHHQSHQNTFNFSSYPAVIIFVHPWYILLTLACLSPYQ